MTGWLRRAGRGTLPDGSTVVWSVAEGRRGRRWREVRRLPDGTVISSLLLETDADGRFSHTELATAAGLLTLHPEGDGTLHGNVVAADGVRHIRGLPWPEDSTLRIEGSPVSAAVAARSPGSDKPIIAIDPGLEWRLLAPDLAEVVVEIDARGIPVLADAQEWPLEAE